MGHQWQWQAGLAQEWLPNSNGGPGAARQGLAAGGGRSQGEWESHRRVPSVGEGKVPWVMVMDDTDRVMVMDDTDRVGGPNPLR
jgi:hypothetical protein